jgi:hypothetical protein
MMLTWINKCHFLQIRRVRISMLMTRGRVLAGSHWRLVRACWRVNGSFQYFFSQSTTAERQPQPSTPTSYTSTCPNQGELVCSTHTPVFMLSSDQHRCGVLHRHPIDLDALAGYLKIHMSQVKLPIQIHQFEYGQRSVRYAHFVWIPCSYWRISTVHITTCDDTYPIYLGHSCRRHARNVISTEGVHTYVQGL